MDISDLAEQRQPQWQRAIVVVFSGCRVLIAWALIGQSVFAVLGVAPWGGSIGSPPVS